MRALCLLLLFHSALTSVPRCIAVQGDDDVVPGYEDTELDEPGDSAFLIARKHIVEEKVVQGSRMTVVLSLFNVGTGPAEGVEVQDQLPDSSNFQLAEGSLQQAFATVPAGRSVEFQYVVVPRAGQKGFLAPAAQITYDTKGSTRQRKLFSSTPYVPVLSNAQNIEIYFVQLGKILSLGVLKTAEDWYNSFAVLTGASVMAGAVFVVSSVTRTQAASKRSSAARDLGFAD